MFGLIVVLDRLRLMEQVTQQNAAMIEETTSAILPLAKAADQLAGLVGRFRIAETAERKSAQTA